LDLASLARQALRLYGLADADLAPIRLTNNAVFEVRPRDHVDRLVLRVHRPGYRTAGETGSELQFLAVLDEQLRGTAVTVPRPVAALDGRLLVQVSATVQGQNATRQCDLLTWIGGRVLRPTRGLGPRLTFLLGEALGRIHSVAEAFQPSAGFELPRWDADALFTLASPFRPGRLDRLLSLEDWNLVQQVAERTRAAFAELERGGAQMRVIHADYILGNCLFRRSGNAWQLGVLDFDDLGWGYFAYDLCPLLGNLADFPNYTTLRRLFLDGYRSVRDLPSELEPHLPILMAARHAVSCAWLAGMERTGMARVPVAEHLAIRMQQIRQCLALPR
jgi:Ser/Thr protein kinase RdoA (MazF antagonist)